MNEFLRGTRIGRIGKKKAFSLKDIPDLSGKIAIVTGASTGLGKETAIALAAKGASVIVAARNEAKGEPPIEKVLQQIRKSAGVAENSITFIELDLASLESVLRFTQNFKKEHDRLDILVNNAGVSLAPYLLSQDGLELHFAVNHLGHFYLTNLLIDPLLKAEEPRIVVVSSRHHHDSYEDGIRLSEKEVNQQTDYHPSMAYGHSKLCNLLFMKELHRRYNAASNDKRILVNAAHPGFVNASGITRHISASMGKFSYYAGRIFQSLVALPVPAGALTQIYLAASDQVSSGGISGQYYGPIAEPYTMSTQAENEILATRLWTFSEKLIREKMAN